MIPYGPVKVHRWTSSQGSELYVFDSDGAYSGDGKIIKETIYKDFTVEDAVARIGLYIDKGSKFYAWVSGRPLLFDVSGPWRGYNVNPFKSSDHLSNDLKEPVQYEYKTKDLFCYSTINIAFEKDLPKSLKGNSYYFTGLKMQTYNQYKKHDERLFELKNLDAGNIKSIQEVYTRISLRASSEYMIAEVFDNMNATRYFEMVQWVNDTSKILYKVWKDHKISNEYMTNWTNIDKIARANTINVYSSIDRNRHCKTSIDSDGTISLNYILDSRKYTKWSDVQKHKDILIKGIEAVVKRPVKPKEIALNVNVSIEINNPSIKNLINNLGKFIDIFHTIRTDFEKKKQIVVCTYKRSSNYKKSTDIYDYIKSRIAIGISKAEIVAELNNLGVLGDLERMVDDEIDATAVAADKENFKVQDNGTILVIQAYHQGFTINITNCPNYKELQYMLFWLTKIVSLSFDKNTKKNGKKIQTPIVSPLAPSSKKSSSSSSVSYSSINFDSLGGSSGGGRNNYFINMLQQADKDMFGENYARDKCQVASQPIVFTEKEKNELEKNNQMHFDNFIKYGSRKEVQNYYACPRLWCPQSKVPLDVNDPDARCPLDNEEPLQMLWNKDKSKKRFVKLTKANDKGMCVPCCMKLQPKPEDTSKCMAFIEGAPSKEEKVVIDKNDENYIMNKSSPIPLGRYGSVPEYLHHLLYGNKVSYDSCTKTLNKTHRCFVRKGVDVKNNDSMLQAVVELLGFKDKKSFISDVKKRLNFLTFITLDNGKICRDFLDVREINPNKSPSFLNELNSFRKRSNLFDINSNDTSRLLNVFKSYKKYIDYLSADTPDRQSSHVYSLVQALYSINVMVFEKIRMGDTSELRFECSPYYVSYQSSRFGIIIKEDKYYEPVVFKLRSADPTVQLKLDDYPSVRAMLDNCPSSTAEYKITNKLFSLNNWIKSGIIKNHKKYVIDTVFINNDFTINKFKTTSGAVFRTKTIGISFLDSITKNLGVPPENIRFYEDFVGKKVSVAISRNAMRELIVKCESASVQIIVGDITASNADEEVYTYIYKSDEYNKSFMVHSYEPSNFYDSVEKNASTSKRWYELQKMVANTIVKRYDDNALQELQKLSKLDRITKFVELFKGIPHKKKIGIILEEMPTNSTEAIKRWLSNVLISAKYNYFSSVMKERDTQYVFSQSALVVDGIHKIPRQLKNYSSYMPNSINVVDEDVRNVPIVKGVLQGKQSDLPDIFQGSKHKLPSKWSNSTKNDWKDMEYTVCEYKKNTLEDFFKWFAERVSSQVDYADVKALVMKKHIGSMSDRSMMIDLFQDHCFMTKWLKLFVKGNAMPRYTPQDFYDKKYSSLTHAKRLEYMMQVVGGDDAFPNDLDILSVSELMNISVLLILSRSKYTTSSNEKKRGDIQDLVSTSSFFMAGENFKMNPFVIMHKVNDKLTQHIRYYLVFNSNRPDSFYYNFDELPGDVRLLIDGHNL